MNRRTKKLHAGYRKQHTEVTVVGNGKAATRCRVRKQGALSFKEWVRAQPKAESDGFFDRKRQAG